MTVDVAYDVQKAVDILFQGLVTQANLLLAATERYQAKGAELDAADVPGILARANTLLASEILAPYVPMAGSLSDDLAALPDHAAALSDGPAALPRFQSGHRRLVDRRCRHGGVMIIEPCRADDIRAAPNFDDLVDEYAHEAGMPEMPWPRVDWPTYLAMEQVGTLYVFAARQDDVLAGFCVVIITMMPEYGVKLACTEAFFVAKAYRSTGAGLKLLAAAEAKARAVKAPGLAISAPVGGKLAGVLPKCGFRHVGQTFFKSYANGHADG